MEYILQEARPKDCIFCVKGQERKDKENLVLLRSRWTFVILNAYPYNNGHLMVVPYRHVAHLEGLSREERVEMMEVTTLSVGALKRALKPDGFNVGLNLGKVAGAGIEEHLHIHVVPRWQGDTNFMPVLAETRVLPEYLHATYERLRPFFEGEKP